MLIRLCLIGIGLVYAVFALLYLTGTGAKGPHNSAIGVLILGSFLLSLVLHVALVVSARSWAVGGVALLSGCALVISLFWVLMRVTGDSL